MGKIKKSPQSLADSWCGNDDSLLRSITWPLLFTSLHLMPGRQSETLNHNIKVMDHFQARWLSRDVEASWWRPGDFHPFFNRTFVLLHRCFHPDSTCPILCPLSNTWKCCFPTDTHIATHSSETLQSEDALPRSHPLISTISVQSSQRKQTHCRLQASTSIWALRAHPTSVHNKNTLNSLNFQ